MDEFILRALAGGVCVAVVAAPIGCVVVWRRMAYFGATLAHAALLGIALGLMLEIDLHLGILVAGVVVAAILFAFERAPGIASDTLLAILAHVALALGLVVLSFMQDVRTDLMGYLFGDVLSITRADLVWIAAGAALCLLVLWRAWDGLLSITVHEDLARVEGVAVDRYRALFLLLTAFIVAIAMQVVGLLLTVSLLVLPAAAARRFSATPEAMAMLAATVGIAAVAGGLGASLAWDTPTGPSIVLCCALFLVFSLLPRKQTHRRAS